MCYACWIEQGQSAIVNQKTIEATLAVNKIYLCKGGEVGGALHIILDGWNVGDRSIKYCRDVIDGRKRRYAILDHSLIIAERDCLERFEVLTEKERCSALAISENLIEVDTTIVKPRLKHYRSHRKYTSQNPYCVA